MIGLERVNLRPYLPPDHGIQPQNKMAEKGFMLQPFPTETKGKKTLPFHIQFSVISLVYTRALIKSQF